MDTISRSYQLDWMDLDNYSKIILFSHNKSISLILSFKTKFKIKKIILSETQFLNKYDFEILPLDESQQLLKKKCIFSH